MTDHKNNVKRLKEAISTSTPPPDEILPVPKKYLFTLPAYPNYSLIIDLPKLLDLLDEDNSGLSDIIEVYGSRYILRSKAETIDFNTDSMPFYETL